MSLGKCLASELQMFISAFKQHTDLIIEYPLRHILYLFYLYSLNSLGLSERFASYMKHLPFTVFNFLHGSERMLLVATLLNYITTLAFLSY